MCVQVCELFMNAAKKKVWESFNHSAFSSEVTSLPEPGAQDFLSFVGSWQTVQPPHLRSPQSQRYKVFAGCPACYVGAGI